MKITNLYRLPETIVSAVEEFGKKERIGDISCTEMIAPPMIRILRKKHESELTEDASHLLWALLGSVVHAILEKSDTTNHLSEEEMVINVDGWKISGKPDLMDSAGILSDYKVTSVYAFLLDDKEEWTAQLNIYAYLFGKHGFKVNDCQIVALLRDWQKSKALSSPQDYPPRPIIIKPVTIWHDEDQESFIKERLRIHQDAELFYQSEGKAGFIHPCTPAERWRRPDKFALMKEGRKSAVRVLDSEKEAFAYQADNGLIGSAYSVVKRPGIDVRCESFCPVREFCSIKEISEEKLSEYGLIDFMG